MTSTSWQKSSTDLQRARDAIPWIADDDLGDVSRKSPAGAALLSFMCWGVGHLYVGDGWRGLKIFAAMMMAVLVLGNVLPEAVPFVFFGQLAAAIDAHRRARKVSRFVNARNQLGLSGGIVTRPRLGPAPAANAAPALTGEVAAPGPNAALIARLRKAHALHHGGVISAEELTERKVDLLEAAAPASRDALDELLYDLLPLGEEGVLDGSDFDFLKRLAGR